MLSLLGDQSQEASKDMIEPTLELLATLSKLSGVADQAVDGGILTLLRIVLNRFCSDPSKPHPSVLALVAKILANVAGSVGGDNNDRLAALRDLYRRLVKVSGSTHAYIDAEACMANVLSVIIKYCSPRTGLPPAVTTFNKADAVECGTEDLIVLAMSSSAATENVLTLGSAALQALGVGSRTERLMKDIVKIVESLAHANASAAGRIMKQLADALRNLSACVASSSSDSTVAEFSHRAVLDTVKRSLRAALERLPTARDDQALIDIVAVCAQTVGRLVSLGCFALVRHTRGGTWLLALYLFRCCRV